MSDLQQVVQQVKSDIARGFVFVHMKAPQLETLLAGLEEAQREIDALKAALGWYADTKNHKNKYVTDDYRRFITEIQVDQGGLARTVLASLSKEATK